MSYILEALRRADAERARGAVPGLSTPAPEPVDDESAEAPRPWLWLVAGIVVALGVVLAWRWAAPGVLDAPVVASASTPTIQTPAVRSPEPGPAAVAPSLTQPPATDPAAVAAPVPAPASARAPSPSADARKPAAPLATPSTPSTRPAGPLSSTPSVSTPDRVEPSTQAPSRRTAGAKEMPARKTATAAPVASAASPVAAAEPARRVFRQAELPDEIRRALPRVSIGGSIYSESAASRMIVINGQVVHEGEKLGADLELRQIRMKEAVLEFRGYRYEVPY